MKDYIRYSGEIFVYFPLAYIGFLCGSRASIAVIILMVASQVLIDNLSPPDEYNPKIRTPLVLDLLLVAHLPAGIVTLILMLWAVSPGDVWGIGRAVSTVAPFLPLRSHHEVSTVEVLAAGVMAGFILSGSTIAAHELIHRRSSPFLRWIGRMLLAINGDAQFAIAHVYGHHRNVATLADPATARRGESLYRFVIRSTFGQYRESVVLEAQRLSRVGQSFFSLQNQFLTGLLTTGMIVASCIWMAGWAGLAAYLICILYAKFMLENVNYIQHYGLVRVEGARVEPRHSWDCTGRACTATFYALSRHSHHHAKPVHPFWELHTTAAYSGVNLKWGYLGAMMLAMVPPLWFRLTTPILSALDAECCDPEERRLIREANCHSGLPELVLIAASS